MELISWGVTKFGLVLSDVVDSAAVWFFFFQAEDGIRDVAVTGVQTCALPISPDRLVAVGHALAQVLDEGAVELGNGIAHGVGHVDRGCALGDHGLDDAAQEIRDRKSTRLNSSHGYISYAVFCLKKKKTTTCCAPTFKRRSLPWTSYANASSRC